MRLRKLLIWFLVVVIAIGYNFAIRLPKNENQLVKITPQKVTFLATESPRFTVEIHSSKSLRRFFRLTALSFWPIARAEEEIVIARSPEGDEAIPSSNAVIASEPSADGERGNPVADSENNEIATRPSDARNDTEVVTSTDFVIDTPNPQVLGETTTSETTTPLISPIPPITPITPISPITTSTATTTDPSLLGQALEKVGEVIEQISQSAQEFLNEEKTIEVTVSNPSGEEVFETSLVSDQESLELELPKPEEDFQPGEWELEIEVKTEKLTLSQTLEFPWGVLAINSNKSIYLANEQAYLQIAALNEKGHTLCDAKLKLEIRNPKSETTVFSTETSTIQKSASCDRNNITSQPDYFANFQVGEPGIYEMKLTNLDNGYEITDSFEVREKVPFEVERSGPTRIYPPASYEMTLRIKVNQDFQGEVVEEVPESFEILNPETCNLKPETQEENVLCFKLQVSGNEKKIIWQVNWKVGETYELKYQFDAPDISPQLYLLGPLQLMETKFPTGNLVSLIFQEARFWQIAADEGFKVSLAIEVINKEGRRAKQGDIIAIKPAGWQWGTKEYELFLIVEVDLGDSITSWEDAQKLTVPLFEDDSLWYPSFEVPQPNIIGKRRYKIPFADLDKKAKEKGVSLDFAKITDQKKKEKYQPLEETTLTFDDLIEDKALNKKLEKAQLKIINKVGK